MNRPAIGDKFPAAVLRDSGATLVEFPAVFSRAPATIVFFYRGRW
jgi:hypothetical protein